jgi:alpha-N-arabinofuranosidase
MRMVDPSIELVACGSSHSGMPTFARWEATVLEHCYDLVDYVSLHSYYEPHDGDVDSFLASAVDLGRAIDAIVATADHVGARVRSRRQLRLSVDEWNVWYQRRFPGQDQLEYVERRPLIEDNYDVVDAVVVGSLLITLLQHADRVGIACQAQLVNVIAPILTQPGGPAWRQTIFHPFAQVAAHARGDVLRVETHVPTADTLAYGDVPLVDTTATRDPDTGEVTVLAINRSTTEPVLLEADVRGISPHRVEATTLGGGQLDRTNTATEPTAVVPQALPGAESTDGRLRASLPPVSFNVVRLIPLTKESTA